MSDREEFNVLSHVLVPKHERLTPEEREELLKKYGVKPYQLPQMLSSDPVAKAIGAVPGDVLRITGRSPTAGTSVFYRYVVEG